MTNGRLPFIDSLLAEEPPKHLFHYTDGTGLLGILDSKQMWAGRAADLNDSKEQQYAINQVRLRIENWLRLQPPQDGRERSLLERISSKAGSTNRQIYTVSLSAERDLLSQWRAYCPRSGGVALGLPGDHLKSAAADQGFYLARCLYEGERGYTSLVNETLEWHLRRYRESIAAGLEAEETAAEAAVQGIAADLAQYGPLLKHGSFRDEREWRLVSTPGHVGDSRLNFLPGPTGLKVYLKFDLHTASAPTMQRPDGFSGPGVVVGPCVDSGPQQFAVQNLLHQKLGYSGWHSRTDSPFR